MTEVLTEQAWLLQNKINPFPVGGANMTKIALYAERRLHQIHRRVDLRTRQSLENLNVFENLLNRLIIASGLRLKTTRR